MKSNSSLPGSDNEEIMENGANTKTIRAEPNFSAETVKKKPPSEASLLETYLDHHSPLTMMESIPAKTFKRTTPCTESHLEKSNTTLNMFERSEDECDIVGKLVATKLRKMNELQKIYAEKLISDVIYKGMLNQLSEANYIGGYNSNESNGFSESTVHPGSE